MPGLSAANETAALASLHASGDWWQAFAYAEHPMPCAGYGGSLAGATIDDVARVIVRSEGEPEAWPWMGVFVLRDGRYLYLEAGCDNTGWGCCASGSSWVAADLDSLVQFGLTDHARDRLGLA